MKKERADSWSVAIGLKITISVLAWAAISSAEIMIVPDLPGARYSFYRGLVAIWSLAVTTSCNENSR